MTNLYTLFASRTAWRSTETDELQCISCGSADDLAPPQYEDAPPLCHECRSPLRYLEFPDVYCDIGGGD